MKVSVAAVTLGTAITCFPAVAALPADILMRPRPQTYLDSCQSYGMALAAASVAGSPLKASNAMELREAENELRKARNALAASAGASVLSHTIWKQALEKVSGGQLTLDIKYYQDYEKWVEQVGVLTDVTNAATLGSSLSATLVKTPVLTSVTQMGASPYAGGHIVTVMGYDKGKVSPVPLAVLNPAVKVGAKPEKLTCEIDEGPGDAKYQAYASIESSYKLKKFDGLGYVILFVRKK